MLVIRLQRTGRSGHAQFRIIVQDGRLSPKSGKVVARLGSYNPHTKAVILDANKAKFYLEHGAQPSPRVVNILKAEKVKLPTWVKEPANKTGKTRNPDKYSTGQSTAAETKTEAAPVDAPTEAPAAEESATQPPAAEAPTEAVVDEAEVVAETAPADEPAADSENTSKPA